MERTIDRTRHQIDPEPKGYTRPNGSVRLRLVESTPPARKIVRSRQAPAPVSTRLSLYVQVATESAEYWHPNWDADEIE